MMIMNRNNFPLEECYDPDEIIVRDIDMFHLEVMEEGKSIWVGITHKSGRIDHININLVDGKISTLWTPNTGNMNGSPFWNNEPFGGTN